MRVFIVGHPGIEPHYGPRNSGETFLVDWNRFSINTTEENCGNHRRKCIMRPGLSLTSISGNPIKENLVFWGEYEPYSRACILGNAQGPKALHDVLYPASGNYACPIDGLNTDPYIYGDEFYYICCGRKDNKEAIQYVPDDIILFGSTKKSSRDNGTYDFELDTVFVVKGIRSIESFDVNSQYYKIGIQPHMNLLRANGLLDSQNLNVIVGRMYSENADMFSYVPAWPALKDIAQFKKPIIDLTMFGYPELRNPQINHDPIECKYEDWLRLTTTVLETHKLVCYIDKIK